LRLRYLSVDATPQNPVLYLERDIPHLTVFAGFVTTGLAMVALSGSFEA
jgi:hypothetical protein